MDQFDKMSKEFQSIAELQVYSNAQHETINKLNRTINEQQEKITHLEKLLMDNSIIISPESSLKDLFMQCSDPEAISRTQLKILRDRSLGGELTMEETKRVEIYTKILNEIESKRKDTMKDVAASVPDEELLKLVSNDTDGSNQ